MKIMFCKARHAEKGRDEIEKRDENVYKKNEAKDGDILREQEKDHERVI